MFQKRTFETDVESIESIMRALYESISFPPHGEPDWARLRFLFLPRGTLTPPRDPDGDMVTVLDVDSFVARAKARIASHEALQELGFREREIARRVEGFGSVTHVLSTYEGRPSEGDGKPIVRGVNSIQLIEERGRWWVVSIVWADESETSPIPSRYLPE